MTIHLVFLKPKVFFCFYAYTRVCVQCMWHKYCHQHGTFFLTARTLYAQLTHMQWIFFAAFSWYQTNFWLLNNTGPARCITVEKETETKQQQTFGDATTINDNVDECLYKGVKRYTQVQRRINHLYLRLLRVFASKLTYTLGFNQSAVHGKSTSFRANVF